MVNVMLLSSSLPNNFWGEALYSTCLILNRVPYKNSEKTTNELCKNMKPSLKYLKDI